MNKGLSLQSVGNILTQAHCLLLQWATDVLAQRGKLDKKNPIYQHRAYARFGCFHSLALCTFFFFFLANWGWDRVVHVSIPQRHFDGLFQNVGGLRHQWASPVLFRRPRAELQSAHHVLKKVQTGLDPLPAPPHQLADGVSQAWKGHPLHTPSPSGLESLWSLPFSFRTVTIRCSRHGAWELPGLEREAQACAFKPMKMGGGIHHITSLDYFCLHTDTIVKCNFFLTLWEFDPLFFF